MSRNQERANSMPQRGNWLPDYKEEWSSPTCPHVQASVWDIFKLIMGILNKASHHPQWHGKEGPLPKTRFLLLEIDVRELTKEREAFFSDLQYVWRTKWMKPICIVYSLHLCNWTGCSFLGINFASQRKLIEWPCVFIRQATLAKLKNGLSYIFFTNSLLEHDEGFIHASQICGQSVLSQRKEQVL